ncbi:MAG TPA: HPF/RaiA family ribosome-associated protein [Acidimicrobiales bacterium]|nr:HPF/RaiA family ribosome-associated protein [Acidimicrobiales bacterium]
MDVAVLGCKQTVPDDVRALALEKMAKLGRLNPVLERAEVRMTEERLAAGSATRVCEAVLSGHGYTLRAKAAAHDPVVALAMVAGKLGHQVERLKGKRVARSHPRRPRVA